MFGDPARGDLHKTDLQQSDVAPQPSDEDVVRALVEIENTSNKDFTPASGQGFENTSPIQVGNSSNKNSRILVLAIVSSLWVVMFVSWNLRRPLSQQRRVRKTVTASSTDPQMQAQAEALLQRLSAGDLTAADEVTARSSGWLGHTNIDARANELIGMSLNRHEMQIREAALEAQLAMSGISKDAAGLARLTQAAGNPTRRAWALWSLGALGNRGIDQVHVAKIIGSYLDDPSVETRSMAVEGLALLGTDETIPMLLDRFRNDPSPVVQERAACAMAESGMYTHAQRLEAAGTLIGWLDDPLISAQQRLWITQALVDISGQRLGNQSAAWRDWYASAR